MHGHLESELSLNFVKGDVHIFSPVCFRYSLFAKLAPIQCLMQHRFRNVRILYLVQAISGWESKIISDIEIRLNG